MYTKLHGTRDSTIDPYVTRAHVTRIREIQQNCGSARIHDKISSAIKLSIKKVNKTVTAFITSSKIIKKHF